MRKPVSPVLEDGKLLNSQDVHIPIYKLYTKIVKDYVVIHRTGLMYLIYFGENTHKWTNHFEKATKFSEGDLKYLKHKPGWNKMDHVVMETHLGPLYRMMNS